MSVIEAAAVSVKTMADNTLRLTVDIEPRHAKAAFALFGERGTALALAALKAGQPLEQEPQPEPASIKGGELSKWAALRCQDPEFRVWLRDQGPTVRQDWNTTDGAAETIRTICHITSRAELDNNKAAAAIFNERIRRPWLAHTQGN